MNSILLGGSALILLLLTAALVYLYTQHRRQMQVVAQLQQQLDVFVHTSINVARCVDRLAISAQPDAVDGSTLQDGGSPKTVASRRWLVAEARNRLEAGTSLEETRLTLGLHRDELKLLSLARAV